MVRREKHRKRMPCTKTAQGREGKKHFGRLGLFTQNNSSPALVSQAGEETRAQGEARSR